MENNSKFEEFLHLNEAHLLLNYITKYNFTFNTEIFNSLKNKKDCTIQYADFLVYAKTQHERQSPEDFMTYPPEYYFKRIEDTIDE